MVVVVVVVSVEVEMSSVNAGGSCHSSRGPDRSNDDIGVMVVGLSSVDVMAVVRC